MNWVPICSCEYRLGTPQRALSPSRNVNFCLRGCQEAPYASIIPPFQATAPSHCKCRRVPSNLQTPVFGTRPAISTSPATASRVPKHPNILQLGTRSAIPAAAPIASRVPKHPNTPQLGTRQHPNHPLQHPPPHKNARRFRAGPYPHHQSNFKIIANTRLAQVRTSSSLMAPSSNACAMRSGKPQAIFTSLPAATSL